MLSRFFKKNLDEIKLGGIKIFLRKIFTFFKIICFIPIYTISVFLILPIYLIKPIILIRFISIDSARLGHFLANTEVFLCERDVGISAPKKKYFDIFFFNDISNKQIAKMWKRTLFILPRFIIGPLYNLNKFFSSLFPIFKKHSASSTSQDRDIFNLLDKSESHLKFSEEEIKLGNKFLKKYGLSRESKFICLMVRDSAYLKHRHPEKNWSYHNYRNYEIDNFYEAAEALTKRGYFVFRMGSKVEKRFYNKNKMIIDYANLPERSEFLDVFLGANCSFCISTACGFDAIPMVFRRPIAFIAVPIQYFYTFSKKFLIITKHHFSSDLNKKLSISEIIKLGVINCENSQDYKKKNIILKENSPQEIKEFSLEMLDRVENKWIDNEENKEIQKNFWKIYHDQVLPGIKTGQMHGKLLAKMSIIFLKKNPEWLS